MKHLTKHEINKSLLFMEGVEVQEYVPMKYLDEAEISKKFTKAEIEKLKEQGLIKKGRNNCGGVSDECLPLYCGYREKECMMGNVAEERSSGDFGQRDADWFTRKVEKNKNKRPTRSRSCVF